MNDDVASAGEKRLLWIFLHIPKSAGTSLRRTLTDVYGETASYCYSPMKDVFGGDFESLDRETRRAIQSCEANPKIQLVYGHLSFGFHERVSRPVRYLTLLREPVDRVLSNYYYRCQHGHCRQPWVSLKDYISGRCTRPAMRFEADNLQTRFLCSTTGEPSSVPFGACTQAMLAEAKRNLVAPSTVYGLTEMYEESLYHFQRECGWTGAPAARKERVSRPYPSKAEMPKVIVDLMRRQNALDIELYHFARERFHERKGSILLS